jgi:hypothetical protein
MVASMLVPSAGAQPFLSALRAGADAPLFATYAAPIERSEFVIDEGYHFTYYDAPAGADFTTDSAGAMGMVFEMDGDVRYGISEMAEPPVITASYSDLVRYRSAPFEDIRVDGHFQVYSSRLALHEIEMTNGGETAATVYVYPFLRRDMDQVRTDGSAFTFEHAEPPDAWTTSHGVPYADRLQNVFLLNGAPDGVGAYTSLDAQDADTGESLFAAIGTGGLNGVVPDSGVQAIAFQRTVRLQPGETAQLRIVRGVAAATDPAGLLRQEAETLLDLDVEAALVASAGRYARIPRLEFGDADREATYWNAFSLMQQVMLPAEGQSSFNYYVFSREPTWGWGHGGQVFHESLTMLAYVFMNPEGAMNSQRVYMERQHEDGYINYRTGSYLNEVIETDGERTSSAPWYSWINWEIYRQTGDVDFVEDAYASGAAFYRWWERHRDRDADGLAEWGGHGVLESVRDGDVAVWDEVGWPSEFEALDLNSMLVVEARSLASMADVLGDSAATVQWTAEADRRSRAVSETFWDDETGFFYHVDREAHTFSSGEQNDLKRREIIGFLPLWAGIASRDQARQLTESLTDPAAFWRPNGVPSLAADDPYYDRMGYWNGPVWVEWQYLVFRGLLEYGYDELAAELADRVISTVTAHLKSSHTFWELYSPDTNEAGHHQTYIWTGLVARMMIDVQEIR